MAKDRKKNYLKKFIFFQKLQYIFQYPHEDVHCTSYTIALKREHPALHNNTFHDFFLFLRFILPSSIRVRIRITNAGPDPDPADKINFGPWESGSTTLVLINKSSMKK